MSGTTRKLKLTDLVAISSGQVIGAGVITLIGTAIGVAGMSAWLAYGAAIFVGFLSLSLSVALLFYKGGNIALLLI